MTKKTLLLTEIFPPIHGGSGRWFWELYSRLSNKEYLIVAGHSSGDSEFDKSHELNLERLKLSSSSWGIRSLTGLKYYWRVFWKINTLIKRHRIEVIHCGRCLPEGVIGYLFNLLFNLPYICYIHGEDVEAAATSRELTWIVRKVLSNAQTLICNSQNTANLLLNNWQIQAEKIQILNPGVDAQRFIPTQVDKQIKENFGWQERPVILTVGRLQERKGQDMLIKALPLIKASFPDVIYAIIGGGTQREKLDALVTDLHLQDNVIFMSEISDEQMIQAYQQCDIFALPNRTVGQDIEGFGMVLVEAQACAKPVIAGDSGGTAETMLINETGYIVDCTTPEPLAQQIVTLLNAPEKRAAMGIKARRHVEQTLDWQVHAQKAQIIFSEI